MKTSDSTYHKTWAIVMKTRDSTSHKTWAIVMKTPSYLSDSEQYKTSKVRL